MLTSFSAAIGISRAINYVRERRRNAPRSRSWGRRLAYRTTRRNELRVHHSVPGLAIGVLTGAAAILTRGDDHAFWLSLPFGAGTGLGFDEVALLVERDNPYWGSETIALGQAAAAAAGATVVAAHFHLRGRQELSGPDDLDRLGHYERAASKVEGSSGKRSPASA
jgi:hypothetical protein